MSRTRSITKRPRNEESSARSCRRNPLRVALLRLAIVTGFAWTASPLFAQTVTSLTCTPQAIIAPGSAKCTININQPATPGFFVNVIPANGDAVTPTSVAIPTGTATADFTATVGNITYDETSTLEAFINFSTQLFQLSITAQLQVATVLCANTLLASGQNTTCTVTLNKPSNSPATISLATNNTSLAVPSTVTIPAGGVRASFPAVAGPVANSQNATITASWTSTIASSATTIVGLGPAGLGSLLVTGVADAANNWSTNNCSPGSWRTISGGGFTLQAAQSNTPTTTLGGVQVTINGVAAPLSFASNSQVTFQCPTLDAGTPLQVKVTSPNGSGNVAIQTETAAAPAIFVVDAARNDQGMVLNANTTNLAMPQTPGVASSPAVKGSYVSIFATGLGALQGDSPALAVNAVRVWIGRILVSPIFVGAANAGTGVTQVVAQIPVDVISGPLVPLYLEVVTPGGAVLPSNQVQIAVN